MFKRNGFKFPMPAHGAWYGIGNDGDLWPLSVCPDGVDGVNYQAPNGPLFTDEGRAQFGITEEPDPVRPDDRLFFVHQNPDGSYSAEPRPIDQVVGPVLNQIQARRDALQLAGCCVQGHWLHNDVKSRTQWERMANRAEKQLAAGASLADPYIVDGAQVAWKKMGGTGWVPLTLGFILDVVETFEVQEKRIFQAAVIHQTAAAQAENPLEYDYSQGWPAVFVPMPEESAQ